jgi:hypothetical protein
MRCLISSGVLDSMKSVDWFLLKKMDNLLRDSEYTVHMSGGSPLN